MWNIKSRRLLRDWGQVVEGQIFAITASKNGKHLYISFDKDEDGSHLKQFSIRRGIQVRDYLKIHEEQINYMTTSADDKLMFSSDCCGF